mmetsp:Transcript_63605/g.164143  ORF Transcript_63605/g.164143 Transcript_63605/m.164143 type:complete len:204 (+) Transcript_63605:857-1468(+)
MDASPHGRVHCHLRHLGAGLLFLDDQALAGQLHCRRRELAGGRDRWQARHRFELCDPDHSHDRCREVGQLQVVFGGGRENIPLEHLVVSHHQRLHHHAGVLQRGHPLGPGGAHRSPGRTTLGVAADLVSVLGSGGGDWEELSKRDDGADHDALRHRGGGKCACAGHLLLDRFAVDLCLADRWREVPCSEVAPKDSPEAAQRQR